MALMKEEIDDIAARYARLGPPGDAERVIAKLIAHIREQDNALAEAREVLKFYADPEAYYREACWDRWPCNSAPVLRDRGAKARAGLLNNPGFKARWQLVWVNNQ